MRFKFREDVDRNRILVSVEIAAEDMPHIRDGDMEDFLGEEKSIHDRILILSFMALDIQNRRADNAGMIMQRNNNEFDLP